MYATQLNLMGLEHLKFLLLKVYTIQIKNCIISQFIKTLIEVSSHAVHL